MKTRTVLEGNAFYEIDEECMEKKKQKKRIGERKRRREGSESKDQTKGMPPPDGVSGGA